jgi:hypothetical protein
MLASTDTELSWLAYQERQHHEITRPRVAERAASMRPGGKFRFHAGHWRPEPYVGHALASMVDGFAGNAALRPQLEALQAELSYAVADPSALYLLPSDSFHQTVANTLSADNHRHFVIERGLEDDYPRLVTETLGDLPEPHGREPVCLRLIGLGIFSTAIGALGVFDRESDFQRVLAFRDNFYGHDRIGNLGIRRTRPFIGHVTLAYIEAPLDDAGRDRLVDTVDSLNRLIATREFHFRLPRVELRAYSHLAEFRPLPGLTTARL